jgi:hypothetical protein
MQAERDFLEGARQELEAVLGRERAALQSALSQLAEVTAELGVARSVGNGKAAEAEARADAAVAAAASTKRRLRAAAAERAGLTAAHADMAEDLQETLLLLQVGQLGVFGLERLWGREGSYEFDLVCYIELARMQRQKTPVVESMHG